MWPNDRSARDGRPSGRGSFGVARELDGALAGVVDSYATVQHEGLDVVGVLMGVTSGMFLGLQGVLWGVSAAGLARR